MLLAKSNAVASFEGCNIHDNTAALVCLHLETSVTFHPSPRWNVSRVLMGWQTGGGLKISGTATLIMINTNVYENRAKTYSGGGLAVWGTATLTNTNVYSNEAAYVCARLLPLPRHVLHCPAGTLRVLMVDRMAGDSSSSRARQR